MPTGDAELMKDFLLEGNTSPNGIVMSISQTAVVHSRHVSDVTLLLTPKEEEVRWNELLPQCSKRKTKRYR